jgi:hypothetical protein
MYRYKITFALTIGGNVRPFCRQVIAMNEEHAKKRLLDYIEEATTNNMINTVRIVNVRRGSRVKETEVEQGAVYYY